MKHMGPDYCEEVISSFNNHFPYQNMSKLQDGKNLYDGMVFNLDGCPVRFVKDNEYNPCDTCNTDCFWSIVTKIDASTGSIIKYGDPYVGVEMMNNTNDGIKFGLYPFEQGKEIPLKCLGYKKKEMVKVDGTEFWPYKEMVFKNQTNIFRSQDEKFLCEMTFKWKNDLMLHIGEIGSEVVYIVAKDDQIVSGFYDEITAFQRGDGFTTGYLQGGDLIIENCGDVSSVVVIKN